MIIEKDKEIIKNVVMLTRERNAIPCFLDKKSGETVENKIYRLGEVKENPEYDAVSEKLEKYLYDLSFAELLMLETLMLVGRDGDDGRGLRGEALYKDVENYIKSIHGDKEAIIEYILGKGPLDKYLEEGIERLAQL